MQTFTLSNFQEQQPALDEWLSQFSRPANIDGYESMADDSFLFSIMDDAAKPIGLLTITRSALPSPREVQALEDMIQWLTTAQN